MLFFDSGLIPYKGHFRRALYKHFPGKIKYKGRLKAHGVQLLYYPQYSNRPSLHEGAKDSYVIGNLYEIDDGEPFASDILTILTLCFSSNGRFSEITINKTKYTCPFINPLPPGYLIHSTIILKNLRDYEKTIKDKKLSFLYEV